MRWVCGARRPSAKSQDGESVVMGGGVLWQCKACLALPSSYATLSSHDGPRVQGGGRPRQAFTPDQPTNTTELEHAKGEGEAA